MTALITCNFCHVPLEHGYGNARIGNIDFNITEKVNTVCSFSADINLKANFNCTNFHWCQRCILIGLRDRISSLLK